MSTFKSFLLSPEEVAKLWVEIEPHITKALKYSSGELSSFDLFKQAINSKIQVWITLQDNTSIVCVTTTEIVVHPTSKKELHILTLGGEKISRFLDQHETLETFARNQGCNSIKTESRRGFDRLTKGKYKIKYHVYEQELNNGKR